MSDDIYQTNSLLCDAKSIFNVWLKNFSGIVWMIKNWFEPDNNIKLCTILKKSRVCFVGLFGNSSEVKWEPSFSDFTVQVVWYSTFGKLEENRAFFSCLFSHKICVWVVTYGLLAWLEFWINAFEHRNYDWKILFWNRMRIARTFLTTQRIPL